MAAPSETHKRTASLLSSSQSSPIIFNAEEIETELENGYHTKHEKQCRSADLRHSISNLGLHKSKHHKPKQQVSKRRHTMPSKQITNTSHNNYYSRIRFHRQRNDFFLDLQNRQDNNDIRRNRFPDGHRIKNYIEFGEKYRFVMRNEQRKLLGYGAMSAVYKVCLAEDKRQKFAAKISSYSNRRSKRIIIEENRLLHRFGNGLYIKDIYDDTLNKRLVFIQPNGKDLKTWWNHKEYGVKKKFQSESHTHQEWILKKILYEILLNLKQIHDGGYIHHDIKPQNILVVKKKGHKWIETTTGEWINKYSFHIIDYGLSVSCPKGKRMELDSTEIRFGTFGYNAWELMNINVFRTYNHSIDLYALGIAICELIVGQHILRQYNDFKYKQEEFCYQRLIEEFMEQERYQNGEFNGFAENDLYAQTLRLKCEHWRKHFERSNGISNYNGDESCIRSIVIKELQQKTPYTTRFKNFISNIIRDDPKRRISSVQAAINHDLFYNV